MSERTNLCKSLVKTVSIIRDGQDHSDKANRCMVETGQCIGYYAVLIDYDEDSDTFCVGWQQRVPAAHVDKVAFFDAMEKLISIMATGRVVA